MVETLYKCDINFEIDNRILEKKEKNIYYENPNLFYKFGRKIGMGGSGSVYRCKCNESNKIFAIKVMLNCKNVLDEIQVWNRIPKNKNIIELIEVFIWEDYVYAVMEMMSYSLTAIIPSHDRHISLLSPQIILNIVHQLIQAVKFLHDNGIAHSDIKSDNVLFDSNGVLKLADFGVSTFNDDLHHNAPFIGTLWWSSPNSLNRSTASPIKDDVWSLAITILEILGVDPPFFQIKDHKEAFLQIKNLKTAPELPKFDNYGENFSGKIHGLLEECFQIDTNERFSSEEVLMLFEKIFANHLGGNGSSPHVPLL